MDALQRENRAGQQLWGDCKGTLRSLVIPFYHQWSVVQESSAGIRKGESTLLQEAPRFLYAASTAIPSLASAAFVLPLIPSWPISFIAKPFPAVARFGYGLIDLLVAPAHGLLMTRPVGHLFRATNFLGMPLILASLAFSLINLAGSVKDYIDGTVTGRTVFYSFANDLFLTGGMLLFIGFRLKSTATLQERTTQEMILRIENPRAGDYKGGSWDKLLSLRDLMFRSAGPAVAFYGNRSGFAIANQIHAGMDARMLWRAGYEKVVIKGGEHLRQASVNGTMVLQYNHTQLPDFSATDLAARALGVDQAQFLKGDLAVLPVMRLVGRSWLGRRVIVADKNFAGNADRMYEMFSHPFAGRERKAFIEYVPWTRTNAGKNNMVGKRGTVFEKHPETGEIVKHEDVDFGPDQAGRLWKPHWEPYARALQYARDYDENFQVVRSVIRLKDFKAGAYRTVEIEFFEPVAVRPYLEQITDTAWNERDAVARVMEMTAKRFRDDDVEWMKRTLLGDGYFTSYADAYYEFARGKGGLLKSIGLGK